MLFRSQVQKIMIDRLENIDDEISIYLKDNETSEYHNLRDTELELTLPSGEYTERFSIVFTSEDTSILAVEDEKIQTNEITVFVNNVASEIIIKNAGATMINKTKLYNVLGKTINTWTHKSLQQEINLPINDLNTGVYIVHIETDNGNISQKIIIE